MGSSEPDIKLAGLSIWVRSRQYPDSNDYWDGNWLNVSVHLDAPGAHIEVQGSIIRVDELARFRDGLVTVHRDLSGTAELQCMEPELAVKVTCQSLGRMEAEVQATPDHLAQSHRVVFQIDQSHLPATIAACTEILERYPIKGSP